MTDPVDPAAARAARRAALRRRMKLGVGVGALLVTLVVGEVLARAFAPESTAGRNLYVADDALGFRLRPGFADDRVTINAEGLRDPHPVAKPAGVRRVLVLGDSFSFGSPEDQLGPAQIYPRLLEARLGDDAQVINAGVPGWGTVQQAGWLARDGLAYAPDLVVVGFFVGNDVWENRGGEDMTVVDGALVPKQQRKPRSWLRRTRNKSRLYRLLRDLPEQLGDRLSGDSTQARWYHKIERSRMAVCLPDQEGWDEAWSITRRELGRIRDMVAPAPVVVLVIPDEFQVDPALREAVAARDADLDLEAYDLELPQRRLGAIAADLGLTVVDLLEPLRAQVAAGEAVYVPLDSHWNAAGHALAVEALLAAPPLAGWRP